MSRHHLRLDRKRWELTRRAVIERDNWRCRRCGKPGGPFEVDHIVPLHRDPEQDPYDPDGCQALCAYPCHAAKTREENRRVPTPAEREWLDYVDRLAATP